MENAKLLLLELSKYNKLKLRHLCSELGSKHAYAYSKYGLINYILQKQTSLEIKHILKDISYDKLMTVYANWGLVLFDNYKPTVKEIKHALIEDASILPKKEPNRNQLVEMTVKNLRALAHSIDIKIGNNQNKQNLINMILMEFSLNEYFQ